jgi:hypothetical protein
MWQFHTSTYAHVCLRHIAEAEHKGSAKEPEDLPWLSLMQEVLQADPRDALHPQAIPADVVPVLRDHRINLVHPDL